MRDDSHQAIILRQTHECRYCLPERFLVERSEPLVHEHSVKPDPARGGLYLIRKTERQRKRCLERFTAGECSDTALRSVVVIKDVQLQTALSLIALRRLPPFQLILVS